MLQTHEQILDQVKRAKRVLLTCQEKVHVDSLASCLALALVLQKMNIPTDVAVAVNREKVEHLAFLPGFTKVKHGVTALRQLVIKVSCREAKPRELRYDMQGDELVIHVTAAEGAFKSTDVKAEVEAPEHDLIIICDTPDLTTLGELYREHTDFFYNTPIINIDHSAGNENYGQINLIDIKAVSTSEVIFRLLETIAEEHFDADIATALLAGMIAKTSSFKTASVTPKSLIVASELIQHGARRDDIIRDLYRQHRLETLRLWGRVLARLQHDEELEIVWSLVRRDDFQKAGTDDSRLPGVIDELIMNSPKAKTVFLIYEDSDKKIRGWLKTETHHNALEITKQWNGSGSATLASFILPTSTLEEAEKIVRLTLKEKLAKTGT